MFAGFLDQLEDHMSNAGCNDYTLPNTPENKKFLREMISASFSKDDAEWMLEELEEQDCKTLYTIDSSVFGYLRRKLGL